MEEHTPVDERDDRPADDEPAASSATLVATVVASRDQPAECTIHPADLRGFERTTTWITASEDSFVSLEEMR